MKAKIHPEYNDNAVVTCACGAIFKTGSTQSEIRTELCAECHPFYTGKQKLVDTARRVEKLQERLARAKDVAGTRGKKKERRAARTETKRVKVEKDENGK